jgi:hypothetical protein
MRIERIITKQGHPVPKQATSPKGPFPPELFRSAPVVSDYIPQPDSGDIDIPIGATAQNNFQPIQWYSCNVCNATINERELERHGCLLEDG